MTKAIRVGDHVRRRSNIYAVGEVVRMIRADSMYYRRAEVKAANGEVWIVPVHDLVVDR